MRYFNWARGSVDEIGVVDQIEADLRAKCFIVPAAGHLTKTAAHESRAVVPEKATFFGL